MEKHVSITRALKEKSRLVGRINILTDVINHQNSLAEGSTRSIDLQDAYRQVKELSESLIKIKAAIAREHAPGLTPRQIVEKFRTIKMVDITRDNLP